MHDIKNVNELKENESIKARGISGVKINYTRVRGASGRSSSYNLTYGVYGTCPDVDASKYDL